MIILEFCCRIWAIIICQHCKRFVVNFMAKMRGKKLQIGDAQIPSYNSQNFDLLLPFMIFFYFK